MNTLLNKRELQRNCSDAPMAMDAVKICKLSCIKSFRTTLR